MMLEIGSFFTGQVRAISNEGYGVVDHNSGITYFIYGTFPGDEGEFEVVSRKKRYGYAKIRKLTTTSLLRIDPPLCPHLGWAIGQCGGCPWMAIHYSDQLRLKQQMLAHAVARAQLVNTQELEKIPAIIPSPRILGYRNRAQLKTDGNLFGFFSRFSKKLAPISNCLVLTKPLQQLLQSLDQKLPKKEWEPKAPYLWSYFEIDEDIETPDEIVIGKRRPFRQANTEQNAYMQNWLFERMRSLLQDPLRKIKLETQGCLELFCGSGNFTEVLAAFDKRVVATDIACDGLTTLRQRKITEPKLSDIKIVECNLFKPSDWRTLKLENPRPSVVLLDPPREGFEKMDILIRQLHLPPDIIYISCSLETFARDARGLIRKGYELIDLLGVDQFPHTPHLELLSHFQLKANLGAQP